MSVYLGHDGESDDSILIRQMVDAIRECPGLAPLYAPAEARHHEYYTSGFGRGDDVRSVSPANRPRRRPAVQ